MHWNILNHLDACCYCKLLCLASSGNKVVPVVTQVTLKTTQPNYIQPSSSVVCATRSVTPLHNGAHHWSPISLVSHLIGPPISNHTTPIPLVPHLIGTPDSLVSHLIGPLLIDTPIHKSPTTLLELIGSLYHWSPFSLVHPLSIHPNGPPSHWSPISLVPHPISTHVSPIPLVPPPWEHSCHWSPISLVPQRYPGYTVRTGPSSHWSLNVNLGTQFSLVPHLIGPPV